MSSLAGQINQAAAAAVALRGFRDALIRETGRVIPPTRPAPPRHIPLREFDYMTTRAIKKGRITREEARVQLAARKTSLLALPPILASHLPLHDLTPPLPLRVIKAKVGSSRGCLLRKVFKLKLKPKRGRRYTSDLAPAPTPSRKGVGIIQRVTDWFFPPLPSPTMPTGRSRKRKLSEVEADDDQPSGPPPSKRLRGVVQMVADWLVPPPPPPTKPERAPKRKLCEVEADDDQPSGPPPSKRLRGLVQRVANWLVPPRPPHTMPVRALKRKRGEDDDDDDPSGPPRQKRRTDLESAPETVSAASASPAAVQSQHLAPPAPGSLRWSGEQGDLHRPVPPASTRAARAEVDYSAPRASSATPIGQGISSSLPARLSVVELVRKLSESPAKEEANRATVRAVVGNPSHRPNRRPGSVKMERGRPDDML